jgi:hypothetical protein
MLAKENFLSLDDPCFLHLPNLPLAEKILLFKSTSMDQTETSDLLIGQLIFFNPYRKKPHIFTIYVRSSSFAKNQ